MIFNLLDATSNVVDSSAPTQGFNWSSFIMIGFFAVLIVVMMVFNRRAQKKREEESKNILNNLKPGNTVKTIGGICGTVVEVCDDGTFVMETGTEKSGKSVLKFDKFAIAQTDAASTPTTEVKEEPQEELVETEPVEEENSAE